MGFNNNVLWMQFKKWIMDIVNKMDYGYWIMIKKWIGELVTDKLG